MKAKIKNLKAALKLLGNRIKSERRPHIHRALQIAYSELDNDLFLIYWRSGERK